RGCGLSEWRPDGVTISDLSGDLAGLLDALSIAQPCAVVGCAVGAGVAIHFASRFPDRTAALIAMSPSVGLPPDRRGATIERAARLEKEGVRPGMDDTMAKTYPEAMRGDAALFAEIRL